MTQSRWRAPTQDGAVLVAPTWGELPGLIERNQRLVEQSSLRVAGRSLSELRKQAAEELHGLAKQYADDLGLQAPSLSLAERPLIATGHQPELYHPGVLVKNFATHELAHQLGGVGFNLTVDSDVAKSTILKVPVSAQDRYDETLHFSHARAPLPYEEWVCDDEALFGRLPEKAHAITHTWPWEPVLDSFWAQAQDAAGRTKLLPERWLIARHHLEVGWGVVNHELPMSRLCGSAFFGLVFGVFVERRGELAAIYNEELTRYRREQKVRSRHHPVADLEVTENRIELPFWAWRPGTTQRGRLFARSVGSGIDLPVSLPEKEETIPGSWPAQAASFQRHWPELLAAGWKIRPKALVTSMMMRLFVADLFLHGIGGAVYDDLTDRIFRRFFATELPAFAVVTATLRLPWEQPPVGEAQERRLRQTLRALHWNPDRFLDGSADAVAESYRRQKDALMGQPVDGTALRERHLQFETIRERLRPYVAGRERATGAELHDAVRHHRRDEHLFSREHPWMLYPEASLLRLRDWLNRPALGHG